MKKRMVVFFSVAVMMLAMLAGCNRIPTAEELVLKNIGTNLEVADMDLKMNIGMSASAEGMTADMSLAMDANVKTDKEVSYMQGKMTMEILGMEVAQEIESWSDLSNYMTYTYNSMYDCWISQEVEAPEISAEKGAEVGLEIFGALTMQEVADEDTEYVVTTSINLGDAYEIIGSNLSEVLEATESLDLSNMNMIVTLKFDRETEALTSIAMAADEASLAALSDGTTRCTVLEIVVSYNEVEENLVLEIPAAVIEEAVSADEMMSLLDGLM